LDEVVLKSPRQFIFLQKKARKNQPGKNFFDLGFIFACHFLKFRFGACFLSSRALYYMACVPQFDTMHPSMSLGAIFNDRIFRHFSLVPNCIEKKSEINSQGQGKA